METDGGRMETGDKGLRENGDRRYGTEGEWRPEIKDGDKGLRENGDRR